MTKKNSNKKSVLLLGATGSIGLQTLDVIRKNPDELEVYGLVSFVNKEKMAEISKSFECKNTLLVSLQNNYEDAFSKIMHMINSSQVDIVVNAMSGAVGLEASYQTLKADKILALANKESLVVGGDLIMPLAHKRFREHGQHRLLPIDSEHGAIFQCLIGEEHKDIKNLWITASGGPFRGKNTEELKNVTRFEALAHPTWNMGPKISIESATMMNKGLEVIEAHHLFDIDYENIKVAVQPQSAIHSMVEYCDGSIKAHMGTTDMRIPIQYALSYPNRWNNPVEDMDFFKLSYIEFEKPDYETFKCLEYAYKAGKVGGTMPCIMNAANEIAVNFFLANKCKFLDIPNTVEKCMEHFTAEKVLSIEQLKVLDLDVRRYAKKLLIT